MSNGESTAQVTDQAERDRLQRAVETADGLAASLEKRGRSQVSLSMFFDVVTVFFGVASPALTTFVAYNQGNRYLNLSMILVVSVAVSLPTIKRLLGIKKRAIRFSAAAFDLRGAVSDVHGTLRKVEEDVMVQKRPKYYEEQEEFLRERISDVRKDLNKLTFDIMEEASSLAERQALEMGAAANKSMESGE